MHRVCEDHVDSRAAGHNQEARSRPGSVCGWAQTQQREYFTKTVLQEQAEASKSHPAQSAVPHHGLPTVGRRREAEEPERYVGRERERGGGELQDGRGDRAPEQNDHSKKRTEAGDFHQLLLPAPEEVHDI